MSFGVELFSDVDGTPFADEIDACFSVKSSYDHTETVFQKTMNDGISEVGTGQYAVRVAPEDTQTIDTGNYYYSFDISCNGDQFTFLDGMLTIMPSAK